MLSDRTSSDARGGRITEWTKRVATRLYQDSIIHHYSGINDRVRILQHSPLGMFFYNQRAIFFGLGGLFLLVLTLIIWLRPHTEQMLMTVLLLSVFWGVGVNLTMALHLKFIRELKVWAKSPVYKRPLPVFGRYFLLDFFVVLLMIFIGRRLSLNLDMFTYLIIANTVVYSAYLGGGRKFNFSIIVPLLVVTFMLFPGRSIDEHEKNLFYIVLFYGPLIGMFLVTVLSVSLISWLRATEQQITHKQLLLLGQYVDILSEVTLEPSKTEVVKSAATKKQSGKSGGKQISQHLEQYDERRFREQAQKVLEHLCSLGEPFWYDSACLWFVENHQEHGKLLLIGPNVNFDQATQSSKGIDATKGFLSSDEFVMLSSLKNRKGKWSEHSPRFYSELNAPAAFIPLRRRKERVGVLAIYGKEGSALPGRQEGAFLRSLGSIISSTMEQWEGRYKDFPQKEMDDLFECKSLDEVFGRVVKILQKYLMAEGCMVIFRRDPNDKKMMVKAVEGFDKSVYALKYEAGRGQTGGSAQKNISIRCDDVRTNRKNFDRELLESLEKAHGKEILSWMSIPIGSGDKNFGVIKVVNSIFRCEWFTERDQKLGEDLARHLQVIVEKFLYNEQYIEKIEDEKIKAEQQAQKSEQLALEARKAAKQAKQAADQRKTDLMNMTHQLQAPLIPVIGALSRIQKKAPLSPYYQSQLEYAQALAEACLVLCWGVTTTFAQAAGQQTSYDSVDIDAPKEMKKLVKMLQLASSRPDLKFEYRQDRDFPKLRMDKNVFVNVLFSLIHNAMKYADDYTYVVLECSFERSTDEAALKVKSHGEPIHLDEIERIFEQFERGRSLEKSSRKHSGTGLGLWVARQLMLGVGGNITVELSPRDERLSVFVVHLPDSKRMQD